MKQFNTFALVGSVAVLLASQASAQSASDRRSAIESQATRIGGPAQQVGPGQEAVATETGSEAGLQRLISKKTSPFSFEAGSTYSYFYRSNPLSTNGAIAKAVKSGVSDLSGFATVSYDNYEMFGGVFTPTAGFNISTVMHSKKDLEFADYVNQRISLLGDLRFSDGWAVTPSLEASNIVSSQFGTEDYKEFYPNLSLSKTWGIGANSAVRAVYQTGYHFSEVDDLGGGIPGVTSDRLDNWTNSVGVNYYRNLLPNLLGQVYGELSNRSYSKGQNDGRNDFSTTVGCSVGYTWKWVRSSVYANYSNRLSDDSVNEYKNLDAGVSVSVLLKF